MNPSQTWLFTSLKQVRGFLNAKCFGFLEQWLVLTYSSRTTFWSTWCCCFYFEIFGESQRFRRLTRRLSLSPRRGWYRSTECAGRHLLSPTHSRCAASLSRPFPFMVKAYSLYNYNRQLQFDSNPGKFNLYIDKFIIYIIINKSIIMTNGYIMKTM